MKEIQAALGTENCFEVSGNGSLPSRFAVTDLAVATIGAVGVAISELIAVQGFSDHPPNIDVSRRLASLWFAGSIYPVNWQLPPVWDSIAGDYEGRDGWIKLHTNLPHHRKAALEVLECGRTKQAVIKAILQWNITELETAIVKAGGVAAAMRAHSEWLSHPQGYAVSSEPVVTWGKKRPGRLRTWPATRERPLAGLRVLDLTRVLAGPVATRTLAGFGADVLRIDPFGWTEPNIVPDITLGKQCCYLNLHDEQDRSKFEHLLRKADVFVHGYRPGALEKLGYGETVRQKIAPHVIDVSLDAYGWTGPWSERRGFDSLVQMSCGIADAGMRWGGKNTPTPLPVQALDHATGYMMAAACIRAITSAMGGQGIRKAKLSLARTAELLATYTQRITGLLEQNPEQADYAETIEKTPWGDAHRLKPPVIIEGTPMLWRRSACELGTSSPKWR